MTPVRRIARFIPAILVYAVITYLSSRTDFPVEAPFSWFDKVVHFVEFAALGACLGFGASAAATSPAPRRALGSALALWLAGTGLGILDEVHQMFVPLR